jgi:outer membrane protein W
MKLRALSIEEDGGNVLQLGLSVLGKYPFYLGSVTLFPLLGFNYNMVFSWKINGQSYSTPGDLSQLGLLTGIGADFGLTDSLYLRTEGLFHLRFASKMQDDMIRGTTSMSTTFGMGPRIKVGMGIKF